jgi:Uma2 family endonuclease
MPKSAVMPLADAARYEDPPAPVILAFPKPVTEPALLALARENRFETTVDGRLVISPLTGTFASMGEAELIAQLAAWNKRHQLGRVLSSNGGLTLADGAIKGPDGAYVSKERLAALAPKRKKRAFERIAPDAVFELLSPSDQLAYTVAKCEEYVATGSGVAVLVNPRDASVTLYRTGCAPRLVRAATRVEIGPEMPGFTLDAAAIFAECEG